MRNDLPISPKKKFKYSITFQSFDEESLEAGDSFDRGFEVQDDTDTIGDILYKANTTYGIYYPLSFGGWESTEPDEDRDFWEKGIRKYYFLHITNEDGTEISQEENDFITFLLSDGRYEIDKFRDYAVGGIVLGAVALGVGALITYFYFKGRKSNKGSISRTAKSVTYTINGKDRKFPIKDAWKKEHSLENKSEEYEVPQADRYEMGGDASEYYHEIEYGEGGVARAKDVIMNKIGFNEFVADYLVGRSEKFAIWLADTILKDGIKDTNSSKTDVLKIFNERSTSVNNTFVNYLYNSQIREILDWLQHPLTPKQNLRELSFNEALEKAREWHNELQVLGGDIDFTEPEKNTIIKKYPKNSDGIEYYWVFIPSNYCDLESSRMGHCGRTGYGNNLISLRSVKPLTKGHTISDSHITIAYGVNDGKFYQVKGKKNNKPAEKYFPYIFDLIKSASVEDGIEYVKEGMKFDENNKLNSQKEILQFNGFGTEYGDEEDYGFEDMTNEELRELYELKPTIFNDSESILSLFENKIITQDELKSINELNPFIFKSFLNQTKLFNLGIISEKPSTIFEIEKGCEEIDRLLDSGSDFQTTMIIEQILCGDGNDLVDSFDYYFTNPNELVGNLNEENAEEVINEIVKITGLEKSVVEENGIEYYLFGDDENFEIDDFDDISRALAQAQNNADNNDYSKYLYDSLKDSLSELGEVHSLNDEGVKMTIDLSNLMSENVIAEQMDYYDFTDVSDLFDEEISNRNIDLPRFSIDDRYTAYGSSEDFNDNFELNYSEGGSLRPKNTNKNKTKNMKPSKLADGGQTNKNTPKKRRTKKDPKIVRYYFDDAPQSYSKGGMFGDSAKLEFIADAYASEEMANKLREKLGIKTDSLGDNYVISFAYTDYGGDFLDKVAISYFSENYPENTIKENSGWGGENAFVFGEPAKEWIEQTQDYALGFEDFEDFYYEKQNEQEGEDFNYFLDDIVSEYTFDREVVIDWLMENKSGYYGITTQGLDFSWTDLTEELVNEGLIEKTDEEFYAGGGEAGKKPRKKTNKNKDPKIVRYYFEDKSYSYEGGGSLKGIEKKAEKLLEESITYRWTNTDMGSGWRFELESPSDRSVFNIIEEMTYLDEFSPDDMGIEDYDNLSKEEQDYYYQEWQDATLRYSFTNFKQKCMKHLDLFVEFLQKDSDEDFYAEGGEVEDWMEEALASLIEETGNDELEITDGF
jgi:hypothetical protein